MITPKVLRIGLFGALFAVFFLISIFAILNTGDETLNPQAKTWLDLRAAESPSLQKALALAASLEWREKTGKPAGDAIVGDVRNANANENPKRWDALVQLRKKYDRATIPSPRACDDGRSLCASNDREEALREIEAVKTELSLYRELLKEDGLAEIIKPSMLAPELLSSRLLIMARFDLMDLSLQIEKSPAAVAAQLADRAKFWKKVLKVPTTVMIKMIAISNLESLSLFARNWVLADLEPGAALSSKSLVSQIPALKVGVGAEMIREIIEPSLAIELQYSADVCEMVRHRPAKVLTEWMNLGGESEAATDSTVGKVILGRTLMAGFQANRTLNQMFRIHALALSPECVEDPKNTKCINLQNLSSGESWLDGFRNPIGKRLIAVFASSLPQHAHRAKMNLTRHNDTLELVARALEQPSDEVIKKLRGEAQKTAAR